MTIGNHVLTGRSDRENDTVPHMAHFAGTGPDGTRCNQCKYFKSIPGKFSRNYCHKYFEMMGSKARNILEGNPRSCKYFEGR